VTPAPATADRPDAGRAADAIRARIGAKVPRVALILGSGLGELVDDIEQPRRMSFGEIPGFPRTAVAGHRGALVAGQLAAVDVLAFAGRVHMYEGWTAADAGFPVRVAHALGASILFVSNAAGAIDRTFAPGDLMAIADHINLMWRNPLNGPVVGRDLRFPDMSAPYDDGLRARLHIAAAAVGTRLADGVYAGLLGPTYETPAEVRMLDRLGAHAVGMSTVPEVIVARAAEMRVAGVSVISNAASGIAAGALSHAEVLAVAARAGVRFRALVRTWLAGLDG
jgi:purine-nucleoside phosphorylase